jgi:hypothetical protein
MPIRNPSPERAQCPTFNLPQYQRDAYIASPGFAPSGFAILNLVPIPGRCPGLSPVTPLGLKTTNGVAVRLRPDVSTRRLVPPLQGLRFIFEPNPGRCPGLSPDTPLGLKTTNGVDLRLTNNVATRGQTVGVFLAPPTAWQRMATIATGGYDRAVDCFQRGTGLTPQRGIMR